jgi:hypothetical protein
VDAWFFFAVVGGAFWAEGGSYSFGVEVDDGRKHSEWQQKEFLIDLNEYYERNSAVKISEYNARRVALGQQNA